MQNLLAETSAQASYHQSLSQEIKASVEAPTNEFTVRLGNLKKGLQASIEKSFKNKSLQEGHVAKVSRDAQIPNSRQARERYESDCLKMNSYTANQALTQGREAEKLQSKVERVRQTIGQNEQDFRQFVRVLESTQSKWENEWKNFCDVSNCGEQSSISARPGPRRGSSSAHEGYYLGICKCCISSLCRGR